MTIKDGQAREPGMVPPAKGISWKMIAAMVGMFVIIIVPMSAVTLPTSRLVVTVNNDDADFVLICHLHIIPFRYAVKEVVVDPGDVQVVRYSLQPGEYTLYVEYSFETEYVYVQTLYESVTTSALQTVHVDIRLME
jgi:predicted phosphodiesterase